MSCWPCPPKAPTACKGADSRRRLEAALRPPPGALPHLRRDRVAALLRLCLVLHLSAPVVLGAAEALLGSLLWRWVQLLVLLCDESVPSEVPVR